MEAVDDIVVGVVEQRRHRRYCDHSIRQWRVAAVVVVVVYRRIVVVEARSVMPIRMLE